MGTRGHNTRNVILLNPFELPLAAALVVTSVVFTFWPEVLEHSPVSFEQRGIIHHVWHYLLLVSSALTFAGLLMVGAQRLKVELVGLCLLIGALGMNLTSVVADPAESNISGLGIAIRVAVIVGLGLRAYIVATEPTVDLRVGL